MLDFNDAGPQLEVIDPAAWDARVERVRDLLKARALEFVKDVLPAARIQGSEARVGNAEGDPGESMSIGLSGERSGVWFDHATGEGGDLIDLWRLGTHTDFRGAVTELEDWLGVGSKPQFVSKVAKVAKTRAEATRSAPKPDTTLPAPTLHWHYLSVSGDILAIVRRYDLDGVDETTGKRKKTFRPFRADGSPGMPDPRPLYRIPSIVGASEVVLVEGEKASDALATIGVEATTQMGGAKADPAKTDWTPLAGKTVFVWQDNDKAGEGLCDRVRPSLEAIGCTVLPVPIPAGKAASWDAYDAVQEGEDVGAILRAARPNIEGKPNRFKFIDVADLETLEPVEWLVQDIFPTQAFVGLYGPSGGLKSFVAVDLALHVATGKPWHGHAVQQGLVIYIAGEGKRGLSKRVVGWRRSKSDAGAPLFKLLPSSVAMSTAEELDELIRAISALAVQPKLIVLDTLARNFGPGDENSQKDMNAFVRAIDRLIEATGATVIVVHHTGKDDAKGERGSSAFRGALDTSIFVKRKGRSVELINKAPHGKQKDADEFDDVRLIATPITFDMGEETENTLVLMPDTSPIIDDSEDETPEPARRLGPLEQKILAALGQAASAGQGLGFTRLKMMCEIGQSTTSFETALRRLKEKGMIDKTDEGWIRL